MWPSRLAPPTTFRHRSAVFGHKRGQTTHRLKPFRSRTTRTATSRTVIETTALTVLALGDANLLLFATAPSTDRAHHLLFSSITRDPHARQRRLRGATGATWSSKAGALSRYSFVWVIACRVDHPSGTPSRQPWPWSQRSLHFHEPTILSPTSQTIAAHSLLHPNFPVRPDGP